MGKYVPLDLDPDLVERVDALARLDERSRAAMIRQLIKRGLASFEAGTGDPLAHQEAGGARAAR